MICTRTVTLVFIAVFKINVQIAFRDFLTLTEIYTYLQLVFRLMPLVALKAYICAMCKRRLQALGRGIKGTCVDSSIISKFRTSASITLELQSKMNHMVSVNTFTVDSHQQIL